MTSPDCANGTERCADAVSQIGEVAERTGLSLRTIRYYGEVLGYDLFTLEDRFRLEMLSGTECAGVATSAGFAKSGCGFETPGSRSTNG